jgi:TctA family transporter
VFCCIGVYSVNNNNLDVLQITAFGLLGYLLYKLDAEPAPFILGFILGPLLEEHLRRAMLLSRGDATSFLTHPISAGLLLAAVVVLVFMSLPMLRRKRDEIFTEED